MRSTPLTFLSLMAFSVITCFSATASAATSSSPSSIEPTRSQKFGLKDDIQDGITAGMQDAKEMAQSLNDLEKSKNCLDCYPKTIHGLGDDIEANVVRSKNSGAAAQYLVGTSSVEEAGIDLRALSLELNDFIDTAGKYYKTKPKSTGTMVAVFTYYPGYQEPYQVVAPNGTSALIREGLKEFNAGLAGNAKCNAKRMCSVLALTKIDFYPQKILGYSEINRTEFSAFLEKNTATKNNHVYHDNKNAKNPVSIGLYIGINGYLTPKTFVEEHMKSLKKMTP